MTSYQFNNMIWYPIYQSIYKDMVILPFISGLKLCPAYFTTSRAYIGFRIYPYICTSLEKRIFTNSCHKGLRKHPKLPKYLYFWLIWSFSKSLVFRTFMKIQNLLKGDLDILMTWLGTTLKRLQSWWGAATDMHQRWSKQFFPVPLD